MTRDRHALIAAGVARARVRMDVERAFWLLGWCAELLREVEPHLELEQARLPLEVAS